MRGRRIEHQRHVGGFDALPAGDRRAVEGVAVGEHVLVDARGIGRHVLHLAFGVGEADVQELDVLVLDHLQHVGGCFRFIGRHGHSPGYGMAGLAVWIVEQLERAAWRKATPAAT